MARMPEPGEGVGPGWDGDKPKSILASVCEGERNCSLVICFTCIFIFACAQAPRGPCLEKCCSVAEKVYFKVTGLKILLFPCPFTAADSQS